MDRFTLTVVCELVENADDSDADDDSDDDADADSDDGTTTAAAAATSQSVSTSAAFFWASARTLASLRCIFDTPFGHQMFTFRIFVMCHGVC